MQVFLWCRTFSQIFTFLPKYCIYWEYEKAFFQPLVSEIYCLDCVPNFCRFVSTPFLVRSPLMRFLVCVPSARLLKITLLLSINASLFICVPSMRLLSVFRCLHFHQCVCFPCFVVCIFISAFVFRVSLSAFSSVRLLSVFRCLHFHQCVCFPCFVVCIFISAFVFRRCFLVCIQCALFRGLYSSVCLLSVIVSLFAFISAFAFHRCFVVCIHQCVCVPLAFHPCVCFPSSLFRCIHSIRASTFCRCFFFFYVPSVRIVPLKLLYFLKCVPMLRFVCVLSTRL